MLKSLWIYVRNYLPPLAAAWRSGWQLRLVENKLATIEPDDILAVVCLRNEAHRMPFFADYYRKLGVGHFLFIDNGSDDEFLDWARDQRDCSVWQTQASYKKANFGNHWANHLLRKYGRDRWCVYVDADEFLVFPFMETRSLKDLTAHLDENECRSFHTVMIDCYGDRSIGETDYKSGDSPFEVCPYFDRDGYIQSPGFGTGTWIQGGPRARTFFGDSPELAPALNKIPLIKWRWYYFYRFSSHDCRPFFLNRSVSEVVDPPTGCLMHFKFISNFSEKAQEEAIRKQHYAGSREYSRYREAENTILYRQGISVKYQGSDTLLGLGLMRSGEWM